MSIAIRPSTLYRRDFCHHRSRSTKLQAVADANARGADRRSLLLMSTAAVLILDGSRTSIASESDITVASETEGFGKRQAQKGDLLLFHYIGTLEASGQVFDSTRGGLMYRDGGPGVFRPTIFKLGSGPKPGICQGLQQGLLGMRIGGRKTVVVPPELGFGSMTVGAPYAIVPPMSTLRYELELIRLSSRGPDELTKDISRCGTGGAAESAEKCQDIQPVEFI